MSGLSKILFAATALVALPLTALADDEPATGEAGAGASVDASAGVSTGDGTTPATATADVDVNAGASMGMYTKETWPKDFNARPLTLAKGMIEIRADVFINMSTDLVGKPIAIAPDIYYGVSDKLSLGLTHGIGLCLTGTDSGCAKVYNDIGFAGIFSLKRDAKMELAAAGGLELNSLDPMQARLNVGVNFKYVAGKIGIYVNPSLGLGLNKRDAGNKETLTLPVTLAFQATPELNVHVRTGIGGLNGLQGGAPLDGFGDGFVIPLGVGALFAVSNKLDVGGEFFFPGIAGSDLASTDARGLILTGNIRL